MLKEKEGKRGHSNESGKQKVRWQVAQIRQKREARVSVSVRTQNKREGESKHKIHQEDIAQREKTG